MSYDEEKLRWEIASLRKAITADWVALASRKTSDPAQRKAVRDHLDMCTCALRAATEQLQTQTQRLVRVQENTIYLTSGNADHAVPRPACPSDNA